MEIRFQPALLQEVIDSFIEKTEREGDPTYYKEFHEHSDPIYEKFMLEDREGEFKKLYQYLFGIWGFSDIIRDISMSTRCSRRRWGSYWSKVCRRKIRKGSIFCGEGGRSKRI